MQYDMFNRLEVKKVHLLGQAFVYTYVAFFVGAFLAVSLAGMFFIGIAVAYLL